MAESAWNTFSSHVAPVLGVILAVLLDGSSLPEYLRIHRGGNYGAMNPLPGVTMWVACAAWIIYACFLNDIYIFLASLPGFLFGVFYLITAAAFCSKTQRLQMAITLVGSLAIIAVFGFISLGSSLSHEQVR